MMVYFAHPIDKAGPAELLGYQGLARDLALHFDWVFDPGQAFYARPEPLFDSRVQYVNHGVLAACDAVFAILPKAGNTVGTVAEIMHGAELGLPVLVYHHGARPIGLGHVPENVEFWPANAVSAQRHEDVQTAAEALAKRVSHEYAYPVREAKGRQRNAVPGLDNGGIVSYYGPLGAERKYDGDAAWDLPAAETVKFDIGERRRVKTGVYVAPPSDVWFSMQGRSSMFEHGLFVEAGVIDSGWRGELEVKVYNLSGGPAIIEAGQRIAQLIPHRVEAQMLMPSPVISLLALPKGDRGTNGWGSTGR